MESLALLVMYMFLSVLFMGPISLLLHYFKFKILAAIVAIFAILIGGYWLCVTPLPISLIGLIGVICGIKTINKY